MKINNRNNIPISDLRVSENAGLSRRAFLSAGAGLAGAYAGAAAAERARPNIVFIMADDLGYADLSCYGRREYETPHIDSLAQDGVRHLQAYANSAVCSATRTALITGRYQYRLPVGLEEPIALRDVGLPPSHPTLPSILRNHGYHTALVGKWHLGALPNYGPLKSGYDHFWGYRSGAIDYFTHMGVMEPDLWDGETRIEEDGYLTDLLGRRASEMITHFAKSDRPFFLSVHFSAPHWPWTGPNDEAESRRLAKTRNPAALLHWDGGDLKTYGEIVARMDLQVGRVLDALRAAGLEEQTIVVFTSDNGGERFSDTWPFSGKKTHLLEGGIRVPSIVKWPQVLKAGVNHDDIIISMDWAPTLARVCGARMHPDYPADGVDIFALTGKQTLQERTLFWRYKNLDQEACRSGPWKYLKILENTFLFNVVADPLERANLKARRPEIFNCLKQEYDAWNKSMLPVDSLSYSHGFVGNEMPDHFGLTRKPEDLPKLPKPE
ncbi:sulfatase family protein [Hyphococcus sp.]|uniref:sulfatase family protein n=1 Tax=Hyphococcus sp. TaxID=2038636 RepID=UPI003CCC16AA